MVWLIVLIIVAFIIFKVLQSGGNYGMVASNMTAIYMILKNEYAENFKSKSNLLLTMGAINAAAYITKGQINFDNLVSSLPKNTEERHGAEDDIDLLLNYIVSLEGLMFFIDSPQLQAFDVITAVSSQRDKIKRAIDTTKKRYESGKASKMWGVATKTFLESEKARSIREQCLNYDENNRDEI